MKFSNVRRCEKCGSRNVYVKNAREIGYQKYTDGTMRRRRDCADCGHRQYTVEILDADFQALISADKTYMELLRLEKQKQEILEAVE